MVQYITINDFLPSGIVIKFKSITIINKQYFNKKGGKIEKCSISRSIQNWSDYFYYY